VLVLTAVTTQLLILHIRVSLEHIVIVVEHLFVLQQILLGQLLFDHSFRQNHMT